MAVAAPLGNQPGSSLGPCQRDLQLQHRLEQRAIGEYLRQLSRRGQALDQVG